MVHAGDDCPTEWSKSFHEGVSFCRSSSDGAGCYSANFLTNETDYSKVCGRARGFQKGSTDAFQHHHNPSFRQIDTFYLRGCIFQNFSGGACPQTP